MESLHVLVVVGPVHGACCYLPAMDSNPLASSATVSRRGLAVGIFWDSKQDRISRDPVWRRRASDQDIKTGFEGQATPVSACGLGA
eukprot:11039818-Karenia_brevis.AAC.1